MESEITFGIFLRKKRLNKKITLRSFATMLDISPVYMSNIENDRRPAPKDDILELIARHLLFSKEEQEEMYDLAAKSKTSPTISGDLPDYIMANDLVRTALRTAKDVDATDKEWQDFIERLQKKRKYPKEG